MKKLCRICGSEFETIKYGGSRQFCFSCVPEGLSINDRTIKKRQSAKKQAVINLGSKCCKCGDNRPYVLAFHHLDPSEKDDTPSNFLKNSQFEEFFKEITKCILLCCNCHTEFHYFQSNYNTTIEEYLGEEKMKEALSYNLVSDEVSHAYQSKNQALLKLQEAQSEQNEKQIKEILSTNVLPVCKQCGKPIKNDTKYQLCSQCYGLLSRVVERPDKITLLKEIQESNFVQVGKKYGVSDNAIRKWCKTYGLPYDKTIYNYTLSE